MASSRRQLLRRASFDAITVVERSLHLSAIRHGLYRPSATTLVGCDIYSGARGCLFLLSRRFLRLGKYRPAPADRRRCAKVALAAISARTAEIPGQIT